MPEKSSFDEGTPEIPDDQIAGDAVDPEVMELVQAGRHLEAVGRYRELTGASLEEAREVISRL
jgi:ribosomal protein L7/L12